METVKGCPLVYVGTRYLGVRKAIPGSKYTKVRTSTMVIFDGLTAIFAGIALVNAAAAFISRKQVKDSRDAELIAIAAPAE